MKKGKKIITIMIALTFMVTSLLTGCGKNQDETVSEKTTDTEANNNSTSNDTNPIEISFWNSFGGGEGDFVDQIVNDFNESQDEVIVKALRLESNEYYAKLGTSLISGKGPDIAVAHVDRIAPFVKAHQLVELDTPTSNIGFDLTASINASNLKSVQYDDKHYAVPLDTHFHMFYYHKDLLAAAGLLNEDGTPNLGDATPESFKDFLERIKASNDGIMPFAINTPYFQEPFLNLYYQNGGNLLSADNTKAAINCDEALEVLNYYLDLYDNELADINDKQPWQSFHDGNAACWFGGVWEAGWHLEEADSDIGIVPLPEIFGGSDHWSSSHVVVIPAYVDEAKQEAAMKFAQYFTITGGQTWGQAGHVPAGKGVSSSDEYLSLPYRDSFVESQKTVKFAPQTDSYNAIITIVSEQLQNIIFKQVLPEEGLRTMEEDINDILVN